MGDDGNYISLADHFYSVNVMDQNYEPANIVDALNYIALANAKIAQQLGRLADAAEVWCREKI